ncbi:hypothetical protein HDU92_008313 [Lobulomyces angularis]|nr:hypothetical protein HDU92_008313 [Lobulomyces angularis]
MQTHIEENFVKSLSKKELELRSKNKAIFSSETKFPNPALANRDLEVWDNPPLHLNSIDSNDVEEEEYNQVPEYIPNTWNFEEDIDEDEDDSPAHHDIEIEGDLIPGEELEFTYEDPFTHEQHPLYPSETFLVELEDEEFETDNSSTASHLEIQTLSAERFEAYMNWVVEKANSEDDGSVNSDSAELEYYEHSDRIDEEITNNGYDEEEEYIVNSPCNYVTAINHDENSDAEESYAEEDENEEASIYTSDHNDLEQGEYHEANEDYDYFEALETYTDYELTEVRECYEVTESYEDDDNDLGYSYY